MRKETTSKNIGGVAGTAPSVAILASALPRERAGERGVAPDLAPDQLEAEIVTLVGRLTSATYDLLVLIGELDHRGTWALSGALSCAAWLAHHCDVELVTARNQVRVARAMREYPVLAAAMASGDVSYGKARVLVPHLSPEHVDDFVHLAASTPATGLGAAIARWSHGHETDEEIDARHHEERSVSWRTDPDGMVTITARLAPADAASVCAVSTRGDRHPRSRGSVRRRHVGHAESRPTTCRLPGTTVSRSLDPEFRGPQMVVATEMVVHVAENGNTLPDGTPLTDHAVGKFLPEAFVSLLIQDTSADPSMPAPAGVSRPDDSAASSTPSDERANTGCHATVFLQYDHIDPYTTGGPTVLPTSNGYAARTIGRRITSPPQVGSAA